jgi:hypothetical protein
MIDMGRMPVRGAAVSGPFGSKEQLQRVLVDLGVGAAFDAAAIDSVYWRLGQIIGSSHQERNRLEVATVAKELQLMATRLNEISKILIGTETGIHDIVDMSVASEIASILVLDPSVGSLSKAHDIMSEFRQEAARMAHVCTIAHAALPDQPGERGRRPIDWYDDFTALLLEIADRSGVIPTLFRARETGICSGWLLDAARALEVFLDWEINGKKVDPLVMRSPSLEACSKRLERSVKRLRNGKRQNSRAR